MHDHKNIFIAWISSASSVAAAFESRSFVTIFSAVILPVIFFTIGKGIDVALQIYFKRRPEQKKI